MKDNENNFLSAIGEVDECFLEDAKPRGRGRTAIIYRVTAAVACITLVIGIVLSAALLGGGAPPVIDDPSTDAFPNHPDMPKPDRSLAAVMENYLKSDHGDDGSFGDNVSDGEIPEGGVEGDFPGNAGDDGSSESNGSYVEVTDNQVEGIIEGDLYKTTDKYIFRYRDRSLCIYSIDGESSQKISTTPIESNGNKYSADMFLSEDGKTVTIIQSEYVRDSYDDSVYSGYNITKVYSIDVSDVTQPAVTKTLVITGSKSAVRKIGDKIYVVTYHSIKKNDIDIDDSSSYIPGIYGDEEHICDLERIYYPCEITRATYTYVTVFNEKDLSLSDEYAILSEVASFITGVYFTDNHIILEYQSGRKIGEEDGYPISEAFSVVDLIDFSGEELRYRGSLEYSGWAESRQYSFDEHDGYLRMVVSTRAWKRYWTVKNNASLYVYDLNTMFLATSVENFAPEGERATAVRFDNDKLYVCTAETAKFSDPVFYFDLSDYENITQVNTGYIEGFSTSLIDIGEGYLVGIGREDRTHTKIEVYKREGDSVVSVAEYVMRGYYEGDYHSFLIDRENNLIGLSMTYTEEGYGVAYGHGYYLWHFDAETESLTLNLEISGGVDTQTLFRYARAFVRDGYLYLTSSNEFTELVVRRVDVK